MYISGAHCNVYSINNLNMYPCVQGIVIKKVVQRSHGFKRSKSLQEPVSSVILSIKVLAARVIFYYITNVAQNEYTKY